MQKNSELKKEIKKALSDFKSIKTIYKQIPNILTISRILAIIPINILFFTGNILSAFIISCITFVTDAFDGFLARKLDAVSKLGADLDALCDKLLIGGIAIPMIVLNPVMIINIILEGLIAIPNIKAKKEGKNPKSSYVGKAKTVVLSITVLAGYIAALCNLNLSLITSLLAIVPASGMQIATLTGYIKRNKKEEKKQGKTNCENIEIPVIESNNNNKQKELKYKPATIEELKTLKKELLKPYEDINYSKTKNRFN